MWATSGGARAWSLAEAPTAELAQHRAWSAAVRVRPVIADTP
ncbi:ATP-grasp domain-containing protein OS=Streptomyces microflavus OX=1919 GN=G3I39_30060 PE=4 SV=1 [Streptomyces microflavus]